LSAVFAMLASPLRQLLLMSHTLSPDHPDDLLSIIWVARVGIVLFGSALTTALVLRATAQADAEPALPTAG
jgi:hypothetical protein